jgi:DNA-binding transcriptional ArsR family regulator
LFGSPKVSQLVDDVQIAEELGITPAAVSQHLSVLRHAGLVTAERRGYRVPYSVDPGGLDVCCGHLVDVCSCGCGGARRGERASREPRSTVEALRRRERELEGELKLVRERVTRLTRGKPRGTARSGRPGRARGAPAGRRRTRRGA